MIVTRLQGGLGNQMFQYAVGRRLALKNNTVLKLDLSLLSGDSRNVTPRKYGLHAFGVEAGIATEREVKKYRNLITRTNWKLFHNFSSTRYVKETTPRFIPEILELGDERYLEGYWQTEKYFEDYAAVIREDFAIKLSSKPIVQLEKKIRQHNSVGIHVRRGDYVTNPAYNKIYGTTTIEYFQAGANLLSTRETDLHYYIFSDDISWCIDNFMGWRNITFIEKELDDIEVSASDTIRLLSACKHFIISNSTFGWWGSWLNDNPSKIVIAPKKWLNTDADTSDVYPANWIKL